MWVVFFSHFFSLTHLFLFMLKSNQEPLKSQWMLSLLDHFTCLVKRGHCSFYQSEKGTAN